MGNRIAKSEEIGKKKDILVVTDKYGTEYVITYKGTPFYNFVLKVEALMKAKYKLMETNPKIPLSTKKILKFINNDYESDSLNESNESDSEEDEEESDNHESESEKESFVEHIKKNIQDNHNINQSTYVSSNTNSDVHLRNFIPNLSPINNPPSVQTQSITEEGVQNQSEFLNKEPVYIKKPILLDIYKLWENNINCGEMLFEKIKLINTEREELLNKKNGSTHSMEPNKDYFDELYKWYSDYNAIIISHQEKKKIYLESVKLFLNSYLQKFRESNQEIKNHLDRELLLLSNNDNNSNSNYTNPEQTDNKVLFSPIEDFNKKGDPFNNFLDTNMLNNRQYEQVYDQYKDFDVVKDHYNHLDLWTLTNAKMLLKLHDELDTEFNKIIEEKLVTEGEKSFDSDEDDDDDDSEYEENDDDMSIKLKNLMKFV